MRSITLKMVLAFLGIALISIVVIVLLARWNTGTEFSRFVSDRRGEDLVETYGDYYRLTGSWEEGCWLHSRLLSFAMRYIRFYNTWPVKS